LAKNNIGIWHNYKINFLKKFRNIKVSKKSKLQFLKKMSAIGYCSKSNKKHFLKKEVKSFQRHFRQQLINGIVDKECLVIAENIVKKI
jgi:N-acetylmuramoyl-L-alanine amidase